MLRPTLGLGLFVMLISISACRCGGQGTGGDAGPDAGQDAGPSCSMNSECSGLTPICDKAAGQCRSCQAELECGAGFVCSAEGDCKVPEVICQGDEDCVAQVGRTHCETNSGQCVACASDSHCGVLGQVCELASHSCVVPPPCSSDASCTDPTRTRCENFSGRCVACLEDADCNLAMRQSCDTGSNTCLDFVPCLTDAECVARPGGVGAPVCDTGSGDCVGCLKDADCLLGSARSCDAATRLCTGGNRCVSDAGCVGLDRSRCDARLGFCVGCLGGDDCAATPGATCDLAAELCRAPLPCLADTECTDPVLPFCNPATGFCSGCLVDTDCSSDPQAVCANGVCDAGPPGGGRPGSACLNSTECEAASATDPSNYNFYCLQPDDYVIPWKWYEGYCLGFCQNASECPSGSTCLGGACWDQCSDDSQCRAGYGCTPLQAAGVVETICAPRCDPALVQDMACNSDQDCGLGFCDGGSGHCACSDIGGPCVGPGSCRPEAACISEIDASGNPSGWPGGYCIMTDCDPPAKPCPSGSSCYLLPGNVNACLPDCDPNALSSCSRPEYSCAETNRFVAGGGCQSDIDCSPDTPNCFGAAAGVPGVCTRSCGSDTDCDRTKGHICRPLDATTTLCADPFAGGACYPGCTTDAQCGVCSADADCLQGQACLAGQCRTPCSGDAQCGVGNVCRGGACTASCNADYDCARQASCQAGGCTVPARHCDPIARRCDADCNVGVDCDRARSCDATLQSCFTPCAALGDDCGPSGRCDVAAGSCVADCRVLPEVCMADTYCDGASGACLDRCGNFGRGTCTAPEICDVLSGACVGKCDSKLGATCASSTDCGVDEVCWLKSCAARCSAEPDCGAGMHCQYGYACSPCDASRWRCDAANTGLCFDCLDDGNCGSSSFCDVGGSWRCVQRCGGVAGGTGTCNPGEVCDVPAGGLCKSPCALDADCSDPLRPVCDTSSGQCGACSSDAQCAGNPAGEACDPVQLVCVPCVTDSHCLDPLLPACEAASASCVACVTNAHCASTPAQPVCDASSASCVACLADADCSSITPHCDVAAMQCLPCAADADCASGDFCHTAVNGGECHPSCGLVPGQLLGEANASLTMSGFDDGAGGAASFVLFRGSNDSWAYSQSPGSLGADQAQAQLLAFGFAPPLGATLVGVSVELELSTEADPLPGADQWVPSVSLLAAGAQISAPRTGVALTGPLDQLQSFGGPADLWGLPLDLTAVQDVNFGVQLGLQELGAAPDVRARVDRVTLTLHTTTPGGTDCTLLSPSLSCNLGSNRCQ